MNPQRLAREEFASTVEVCIRGKVSAIRGTSARKQIGTILTRIESLSGELLLTRIWNLFRKIGWRRHERSLLIQERKRTSNFTDARLLDGVPASLEDPGKLLPDAVLVDRFDLAPIPQRASSNDCQNHVGCNRREDDRGFRAVDRCIV